MGSTCFKSGEKISKEHGIIAIKDGIKNNPNAMLPNNEEKPSWLKVKIPQSEAYSRIKGLVKTHKLHTVCEEAKCPNIAECWTAGTATFMLLGSVCTRACRFCAVDTGNPHGFIDLEEPDKIKDAVKIMGLKYVVLTSVDRDDLPDGGASHFANCILAIKSLGSKIAVEALTPDFQGDLSAVTTVLASGLEVFAQNVETVKRLTRSVRDPRASYEQTLKVLEFAKNSHPEILTKTSLMLGLGETDEEILTTMDDLRAINVDILTLGQYLRPTVNHLPVMRFVSPETFRQYREWGLNKGFLEVVAGPLVRSSYRAEQVLAKNNVGLD